MPSVWCTETAAHISSANWLTSWLLFWLMTLITPLRLSWQTDKTYHITSEAWTIRGVQNPNYTVPVCLCVVKIQPLQLNFCSGLYVMMTSKVPVSLNNSWDLVALRTLKAISIHKSNWKKLPQIHVLQIAKIWETPWFTCTVWVATQRGG